MHQIIMPKAGQTMEEGTLQRWLKREGDQVLAGETVLEIETDKAVLEVASEVAGLLRKVIVREGETVPVLTTLGYVGRADEQVPLPPSHAENTKSIRTAQPASAPVPMAPSGPSSEGGRISPRARRVAMERHIDLSLVQATRPGGRVTEQDVIDFIEQNAVPEDWRSLSRVEVATGKRVLESVKTIPHFYLSVDVRMDSILQARTELTREITVTDLVVKAVGLTLTVSREANCRWEGARLKYNKFVNVGIVVDTEHGAQIATIVDVDKKDISQVAQERRHLIEMAKGGRSISNSSSITVSNLGMYGVHQFTSIINPPEVAILAVGKILPIVQETQSGGFETVRQMTVTLSCDHRALSGVQGARFLERLMQYLERPEGWLRNSESTNHERG